MGKVDISEIWHVPRAENIRADILSKLANTKTGGSNKSLIQEIWKTPSIANPVSILAIEENLNWMTSIVQYLLNGVLPSELGEVRRLAKKASYYTIIEGHLYKRSLSQPLLKCLTPK